MFWFLVALLLFFLLLDQRKQTKSAFERGQADARRRAEKLVASGRVTASELDQALAGGAPAVPLATRGAVFDDDPFMDDDSFDAPMANTPAAAAAIPIPIPPAPELSPEERTLQNLNTMLYVGSFLIVAAAALFVNLTMPAAVKLTCIIMASVIFYAAGLVLHDTSRRLRPAAVAFVGTGLAILPFAGYATYRLSGIPGEMVWLLTSLFGLVAYGVAAVRLRSQLVSYLTMAFVLSFGLSTVSVLGLGMVWYYTVVIGVALLCNCIHFLWPKALPQVFWQPIEQTGLVMTPLALVASLVAADSMDLFMYEILFAVASLHYAVTWLMTRRWEYEAAARGLVHVTGLLVAADFARVNGAVTIFAATWLGFALAQAGYSLLRVRPASEDSVLRESFAIGAALGLMVINFALWTGTPHQNEWIAAAMAGIGIVSAAAAWRLKQVPWLYGCLAVSVALPFVVLRGIVAPPVDFNVLAVLFAALGALAVFGVERSKQEGWSAGLQDVLTTSSAVYATVLVLCGLATGTAMGMCWTLLVAAGLAVALSYLVVRGALTECIGALLLTFSIWAGSVWLIEGTNPWRSLIAVVLSAAVVAGMSAMHHTYAQHERRDGLAVLAAAIFACLVFTAGSSTEVSRAVVLLLLAGGVAVLALRILGRGRALPAGSPLKMAALASYIAYPLLAVFVAIGMAEDGWLALAAAVFAATLWASSYAERQPNAMLAGHGMLLVSLYVAWHWLQFAISWQLYGVAWIAAGVYYGWYLLAVDHRDEERQQISLAAALFVLLTAGLIGMLHDEARFAVTGAGLIIAAAATTAVHGYVKRNRTYIEVAAYGATVGLQRMVEMALPEANMVVYAHWWAAVVGAMALWRSSEDRDMVRFKFALGLVTASTGMFALSEGGIYSFIFLIEHLAVAGIGALLRKQWAMWWGVVAVVLAILYFLRDYTSLALLFLGFLIVLFVIWRLLKAGDKD